MEPVSIVVGGGAVVLAVGVGLYYLGVGINGLINEISGSSGNTIYHSSTMDEDIIIMAIAKFLESQKDSGLPKSGKIEIAGMKNADCYYDASGNIYVPMLDANNNYLYTYLFNSEFEFVKSFSVVDDLYQQEYIYIPYFDVAGNLLRTDIFSLNGELIKTIVPSQSGTKEEDDVITGTLVETMPPQTNKKKKSGCSADFNLFLLIPPIIIAIIALVISFTRRDKHKKKKKGSKQK